MASDAPEGGMMLPLKAFCVLGMTAMTAVIGWALLTQPPGAVPEYFANVWGVVSMVDLYTGFVIFSAWIWSRESSTGKAVAWTIAMMTTGWLAGCAYCLQAAVQENPPCPPLIYNTPLSAHRKAQCSPSGPRVLKSLLPCRLVAIGTSSC